MENAIREIFFPFQSPGGYGVDWILLALRVVFGTLLLVHGIHKVMTYKTLSATFPDPIGLGRRRSLQLAIFAELLCSLAVISGLLFRLALIPPMVTMCVAGFVALKGAPWVQRELPISYLLVLLLLFITGPGLFSLDALI